MGDGRLREVVAHGGSTVFTFFHLAFHLLEFFVSKYFLFSNLVEVLQGGRVSNENLSFLP